MVRSLQIGSLRIQFCFSCSVGETKLLHSCDWPAQTWNRLHANRCAPVVAVSPWADCRGLSCSENPQSSQRNPRPQSPPTFVTQFKSDQKQKQKQKNPQKTKKRNKKQKTKTKTKPQLVWPVPTADLPRDANFESGSPFWGPLAFWCIRSLPFPCHFLFILFFLFLSLSLALPPSLPLTQHAETELRNTGGMRRNTLREPAETHSHPRETFKNKAFDILQGHKESLEKQRRAAGEIVWWRQLQPADATHAYVSKHWICVCVFVCVRKSISRRPIEEQAYHGYRATHRANNAACNGRVTWSRPAESVGTVAQLDDTRTKAWKSCIRPSLHRFWPWNLR